MFLSDYKWFIKPFGRARMSSDFYPVVLKSIAHKCPLVDKTKVLTGHQETILLLYLVTFRALNKIMATAMYQLKHSFFVKYRQPLSVDENLP